MTSIERLQITGIRSFNPDPSQSQTVHFQKPLTVILGKNGAGKTTIIEALLNACTGAMPPGSGGSEKSSFVYDPKVIGESEVKAQIRLIFKGKDGRSVQVIRSVQVTRVRTKMELKTLDNTVAYQDPATGKVVSNTYRASDVDRVVPELLGVSSSVLKYVVFCHQEESNWPLSPPKDVKEIFDDLFAATRYVTTLEKLRKVSQDKRKLIKEYESSLLLLRQYRIQASELEENIAKKEEVINAIEGRKTSLEPELRELRKAAAELDAVEQQADALAREAAQIAGRMDEKRETICRADLPPSTHTLEQMQELKAGLVAEATAAENAVTHKSTSEDKARQAARRHEEQLYSARAQVQSLESDNQQHRRSVAELRDLLQSMPGLGTSEAEGDEGEHGAAATSASSGFLLGEDNVDERSLQRVLAAARAAAQAATQAAQQSQREAADGVAREEERRQLVLRGMDADTKEREMTEGMLASLAQQLAAARGQLQALGGADACREQLAQATAEVARLQQRVAAAQELRKKGEHFQQRQCLTEEFDEQNALVAGLRQAMARARQQEGQQGDLERLRERIAEQRGKLDAHLQGHVLPQLPTLHITADARTDFTTVVSRTEEARRAAEETLHAAREAHSGLDRRTAALEQKRAHLADQLAQHTAEAAEKAAACEAALDQMDSGSAGSTSLDRYEQLLRVVRAACERAVQKRHALAALTQCYSEFTDAAKALNSCAVCERPFANHDELHRFLAKNEQRKLASPQAMADAQLEEAKGQERLRLLEALQRSVQDVRRLRATVPALEAELAACERELAAASASRAEAAARLESSAATLERIADVVYQLQSLRGIDAEVTVLMVRLASREKALSEERARLAQGDATPPPPGTEGRSYAELTEVYEAATAALHRLNEQLSELQRQEEGGAAHEAERALMVQQHLLYQREAAADKAAGLQSAVDRLLAEEQTHRATLLSLQARRTEQHRQLEAAEKALHQMREDRRRSEQTHSKAVAAADGLLRQLESALPRVLAYIKVGGSRRLQAARDELNAAEAAFRQRTAEADGLKREIDAARVVLSEHSRRVVQTDRAIAVRELERSLEADQRRQQDVEASLQDLKGARLGGVEAILGDAARRESLPRLRELIRAKVSELERAQAQQQGSVEAMLQDVNDLKSQLVLDKFAKIEKRYRSTFLKCESESLSLKDVDNYYAALEVGVQAYHKEKIAQINQIISELWRQTYRGSDIDTIEIRSETEATSSTASKRSYTYRVVIKRGDSELDMRGRCSAGQKVLASIIIRLALSETFCFDCGILALDEPTTNLDEDNTRSLAESLRSLIDLKRNVKNFQLVVITHDEQFVRALGGHNLDHFHYVHKDREGAFSIIEKRTFGQLFT